MGRIRLTILFDSGARIGPGKAAWVESIRDTGSISAAARDMGMSYKRAWLLLDSINRAFTDPVVTAAPGAPAAAGRCLPPLLATRLSTAPARSPTPASLRAYLPLDLDH